MNEENKNVLEIPKFLRREKEDGIENLPSAGKKYPSDQSNTKVELVHKKVPYGKNKLNGQFKDNLALLIKNEVTKGNNTFAKIKKVLGSRYSDNELRCGVRQARKFNKSLGLNKIRWWKIEVKGKTYFVYDM